jgi:hypothetical protein
MQVMKRLFVLEISKRGYNYFELGRGAEIGVDLFGPKFDHREC